MKVYNTQNIIHAGTVMNTTLYSQPMQMQSMYGCAIQVVWAGTPTGTFKLQASADSTYISPNNSLSPETPTNWSDIAESPYSITAAGSYMWNVFDIMYNFIRVVYTDTSGGTSTATITSCTINSKGI